MSKSTYLFCIVKDFQQYIPNLPDHVTLIRCEESRAKFFMEDEDLILDCEAEIWVRSHKRKFFRKVLYAHFGIDIPQENIHEHYILYYICEPEK